MEEDKREYKKIRILSLICMIIFLIIGLLSIFVSGSLIETFINKVGYFFGTRGSLDGSPLAVIFLKMMGAFFLMWAYLLLHLYKNPLKNAVVASGSGIGLLIFAIITITWLFSKEIMAIIPPYIIAFRVLVTAIVGLLFLMWTPRQK